MTDDIPLYLYLELLLMLLKTEIGRIVLAVVGLTFLIFCVFKVIGTQQSALSRLASAFVCAIIMALSSYYISRFGFDTHKFEKERGCVLVSTDIRKLCYRP